MGIGHGPRILCQFRNVTGAYAQAIDEARENELPTPGDLPDVVLRLIPPGKDADACRYNLPTGRSEVAPFIPESILVGDNDAPKVDREIRVPLRNGGQQLGSERSGDVSVSRAFSRLRAQNEPKNELDDEKSANI